MSRRALVTGGASGIGAAIVARLEAEGLDVDVLDLATGFDVSQPGHWERVEALGGTFHVNSQPGSGTQVTANVPISRTRRENGHAALATPTG